jgi:hypothetical protein
LLTSGNVKRIPDFITVTKNNNKKAQYGIPQEQWKVRRTKSSVAGAWRDGLSVGRKGMSRWGLASSPSGQEGRVLHEPLQHLVTQRVLIRPHFIALFILLTK